MGLDQVLPRLFLGSCPADAKDIDQLQAEFGITAVLNLQTDEELAARGIDWGCLQAHYVGCGMKTCRVRVPDENPRHLRELLPLCVEVLERLLGEGHCVYVHCNGGSNRAPSVAVAYLHWAEGWEFGKALRHLMRHRSCSPCIHAILSATQCRTVELAAV